MHVPAVLGSAPRQRRLVAAALAATLAAGISACSGGTDTQSASSSGDATIRIASASPPRSLDPAQLDGGAQAYVWGSIYDTLLYVDNTGKLQPNAAESWTYSPDGLNLTLKIRKGMKFSNGDPVTAEDVKANFIRDKTTPGQETAATAAISSVDANGDTVVVHFSKHDPAFLNNLARDPGVLVNAKTVDSPRTASNPVGSGPYTLDTSASVTGSSYVLRRRPDYWNVKAYPFKTVTIKIMTDQTAAFNALRAGQVDAGGVQPAQLGAVKGSSNFHVSYVRSFANGYLVLADRAGKVLPALGNVKVRQAINLAFDRETIVKRILSGAGTPTDQPFGVTGDLYDKALDQAYPYDPAKAKRLLAEAGYPNGFAVHMPATVVSTQYQPTISQSLADIGIKVTWDPVPPQNSTAAVASGQYPMYFFLQGADTPSRILLTLFAGSTQNPFKWSSPEFDKILNAVNSELDPAKQPPLYKAVDKYVVDNALFAPIFTIGSYVVTSSKYKYLGNGAPTLPSIRQYGPS